MWKRRLFIPAVAIALAFAACTDAPVAPDADIDPQFGKSAPSNVLDEINVALAADGADYRVAVAEYIASAESGQVGNTILAKNVGNKQLGHHFVLLDARRAWSGPGSSVTWIMIWPTEAPRAD